MTGTCVDPLHCINRQLPQPKLHVYSYNLGSFLIHTLNNCQEELSFCFVKPCTFSLCCRLSIEKTEIMWEDSWLDFLDTLLEFSTQWLEGPLLRIWVSPNTHMKEVKDCANMLAVVEKCTGIFFNNYVSRNSFKFFLLCFLMLWYVSNLLYSCLFQQNSSNHCISWVSFKFFFVVYS